MNWLLPRLYDFNQANPGIRVDVLTSSRDLDLDRDAADVAIWWGESWPGLESVHLFSAEMLPVCSPAFLKAHPLRAPADLLGVPRLHVQGTPEDWTLWLDHASVALDADAPSDGMRFDSLVFALRAAAEGAGVALGRLPLVAGDLRAGRLVAPFDIRYTPSKTWHLVYSPIKAKSHKVRTFEQWVRTESRKFDAADFGLPRQAA
jgi:DNA-binding transcriptional LysR family regulator